MEKEKSLIIMVQLDIMENIPLEEEMEKEKNLI